MTRPQSAIAATGLRKSFGDHLVLDGIDLDKHCDVTRPVAD
jgi:hypothetical protein